MTKSSLAFIAVLIGLAMPASGAGGNGGSGGGATTGGSAVSLGAAFT